MIGRRLLSQGPRERVLPREHRIHHREWIPLRCRRSRSAAALVAALLEEAFMERRGVAERGAR